MTAKSRHAGYIALVGRTNVGKSTFLNALMERKIAIVSDKPQTTRKRILGIKTTPHGQLIFFDCPGIHKPFFKMNEKMMADVHEALRDADLILYFVDMDGTFEDKFILEMLSKLKKSVLLVINKIDRHGKNRILEKIEFYRTLFPWKEIVPISARHGDNLDLLEELLYRHLPEADNYFDEDKVTDQSETYYLAELIREKTLEMVHDELPFTSNVKVEEITDRGELVFVRAEIWVENHSQKKIIIGRRGSLLKQIGCNARQALEEYFAKKVFLELFVKIVPGWRNSPLIIKDIFN